MEELATQTVSVDLSTDTLNEEENEQVDIDEENGSAKVNVDVAVNATDVVSNNTTKVNCSSEKIFGPVEVLGICKIA